MSSWWKKATSHIPSFSFSGIGIGDVASGWFDFSTTQNITSDNDYTVDASGSTGANLGGPASSTSGAQTPTQNPLSSLTKMLPIIIGIIAVIAIVIVIAVWKSGALNKVADRL